MEKLSGDFESACLFLFFFSLARLEELHHAHGRILTMNMDGGGR